MIILVVSDFHLGAGHFFKSGENNIIEDFTEDERFIEFLEFYSSGKHYISDIHLVLNGDILNLLQIEEYGVFSHIIDESTTISSIKAIYNGHKELFTALKKFANSPNKEVTYIIGNHDASMAFENAQQFFKKIISSKIKFSNQLEIAGVHIEHGHRFEYINSVPLFKQFIKGPNGKKILNLPWGSLFCIMVLPKLKKDRPLIDKVRPLNLYLKWLLLNDTFFFFKLIYYVLKYLWSTQFDIYTKQNRNFKLSLKVLKQITIYPKFGKMAKSILNKNKKIHTVVMGHTHVKEWRKFPKSKYYFNTGTWNQIPTTDAALHGNLTNLTYCYLNVNVKTNILKEAGLYSWNGRWRPFNEDIKTV